FNVLKEFAVHEVQSKVSAYSYVEGLRDLTDNAFLGDVQHPYDQFLRITHIWDYLSIVKRSGQHHGLDDLMTFGVVRDLRMPCTACPHYGLNITPDDAGVPPEDGNFHNNRYAKRRGNEDTCLTDGCAFWELDVAHQANLQKHKNVKPEKSTCVSLNAVNKQKESKFKGMDVTGVVNIQCSHVVVQSTADCRLGEAFHVVDEALTRMLRDIESPMLRDPLAEFIKVYVDISYDAACQFSKNWLKRIQEEYPDLHFWPTLNQFCKVTRQMTAGHRHDALTMFMNAWNWKKVSSLGRFHITCPNNLLT
ncbi:hypothetical protein FISHEDRAFT_49548, partial [Fistulina hepatica ATCC 64428]